MAKIKKNNLKKSSQNSDFAPDQVNYIPNPTGIYIEPNVEKNVEKSNMYEVKMLARFEVLFC
jgi:hypothetical protein